MPENNDQPASSSAEVYILFNGYAKDGDAPTISYVASTIGFIRDGDARVIVDPGMVPNPEAILEPLAALSESPTSITDVVFSHHHPDHTLNAALFPYARFHDYWAIYKGDTWESREAEGYHLTPSIQLIATPGHTPQDITTLVGTSDGVIAFTHLWWFAEGPEDDPLADNLDALHANRTRVLQLASLIVPGHGAPFTPDETTPR
jgi:glyoxylase-like metal-dependent hydrolase (beta-lactamase superfamily II)